MNKQEILEYNKRCAEFMGLEISINPEDGYDCGTWYKPTGNEDEVMPSPVLYHFDWNWIMEVFDAISKISQITIYSNQCSIAIEVNAEYIKGYGCTKEAVVQAINKFLIGMN